MGGGVFFDCWDTVIQFREKNKDWKFLALSRHCENASSVNWEKVSDFSRSFFGIYDSTFHGYEMTVEQYLRLLVEYFHLKPTAPLSLIGEEVLSDLDPKPMPYLKDFLKYMDKTHIPYAILSNTLYSSEKTLSIIKGFYPESHFEFFFGSADVGVKKPTSLFFQTGVRKANLDIEKSIYIGDSFIHDVYGSHKAGFKTSLWLNFKKEKHPDPFPHFEDINSIPYVECEDYHAVLDYVRKEFGA